MIIRATISTVNGDVVFELLGGDASNSLESFWDSLVALTRGINFRNSNATERIVIPWLDFLAMARDYEDLRLRHHVDVQYSQEVLDKLGRWVAEQRFLDVRAKSGYESSEFDPDALIKALRTTMWDLTKRTPTYEQLRDIAFLQASLHGAVFSVPGAGKTSVALANHELLSRNTDFKLLVVAPKNAFPAWDEALADCLTDSFGGSFTRLTGGVVTIGQLLRLNPRYTIITYDQARIVFDILRDYLMSNQVHLILDESHRIKSGSGKNSQAILDLAPFAARRDILTGTPMPNGKNDLIQQFMFLYPASNLGRRIANSSIPKPVVRPLYARTRYSELGIPRPIPHYLAVEMSNVQVALYALLRDDLLKQIHLGGRDSEQARATVMRILRVAVDPADAARSMLGNPDLKNDLLVDICFEATRDDLSPRLRLVIDQVRAKVQQGEKVVVWAPFIGTIDKLVTELAEFGARALYGQTPSGETDDEDTREYIVKQFHDSDTANVLVANPAAGGEGISLHKVCHSAIYVGRTYNAAHYMQSRDRICRLGMPEGVIPEITIIESRAPERLGSIDLSVRRRLDAKIEQMGLVLDDPDLRSIALESDAFDQDLYDGLIFEDLDDLLRELRGGVD